MNTQQLPIELTNPLVIFDLETTGVDVDKDRIIEIGIIRFDGKKREEFETLVNPETPIPDRVQELTGITDKMVKKKPKFADLTDVINEYLDGADLCGYNAYAFDVRILLNEFARVKETPALREGYDLLDVYDGVRKYEPRTLSWSYKYYSGGDESFDDSHRAMADTRATEAILRFQIEKYAFDGRTVHDIVKTLQHPYLDRGRKLKVDEEGEAVICFGKHNGERIKDIDKSYLHWMRGNTDAFTDDVWTIIIAVRTTGSHENALV